MANVRRAKVGDLVKAEVNGDPFFAEVIGGPTKVSPRVYELDVRVIGAGQWQRGKRYDRLRGRQVKKLYRALRA